MSSSGTDNDNETPPSKGGEESTSGGAGPRPLLASTKRPLMTHSKDGKLLSEKKLRRLEKNRLSARECRRRKREATENLERQINVLEGENLRLRLQLQIGEEAEDKMRQEQEKVTDDIVSLLESGASEAEVYENIEKFKEKFADYGRDRRSAVEFHLRNIERLLMPTQTTTIAMRALQGGPEQDSSAAQRKTPAAEDVTKKPPPESSGEVTPTAESATTGPSATKTAAASAAAAGGESAVASGGPPQSQDPKALFQYLVNHLEVSPEQAAALKDSRFVAQELDSHLEKALKVLEELKTRIAQCGDDLETEFDNVRSILTPTQAAKFLIWVANNGACMHMLNELWGRVYTEENPNGPLETSPSMEGNSP